jgi:hypothetical protein
LTGIRYREEILAPIVRLYAGANGDNFILMDDNATPLALVGSLAGFVDLKSNVARCPKHVLSDLGPETLLANPCARLFPA